MKDYDALGRSATKIFIASHKIKLSQEIVLIIHEAINCKAICTLVILKRIRYSYGEES
ncbi:hypothetical protein NSTC731_03092 [Nostoc sp. DSM 114167]|jgi:hypothetical protein